MTIYEMNTEYFDWIHCLVSEDSYFARRSYYKLLKYLHSVRFDYSIPMDSNRAEDGIDLRYRFGHDRNYDMHVVAHCLDNRDCSVLEMMVALAIRCEEHIMDDPDIGNRTGTWFWDMITNLGLRNMDDDRYDQRYAEHVVERFLNREYGRNGEGGLFTVNHYNRDLRNVEIWYQMCWYLDSIM